MPRWKAYARHSSKGALIRLQDEACEDLPFTALGEHSAALECALDPAMAVWGSQREDPFRA